MILKAGQRLKSVACTTTVIVVKATADDLDIRCGGHPLVNASEQADEQPLDAAHSTGTVLGKRYEHAGLELLCTKPGQGSLSIGDEPLGLKDAKALPASD
jgi:hypothetical protein